MMKKQMRMRSTGFVVRSLLASASMLWLLDEAVAKRQPDVSTDFLPPIILHGGDGPLDTAAASGVDDNDVRDSIGYAAPYLGDVDGDGALELVVGTFSGRFRIYSVERNGVSKARQWLQTTSGTAQVPIFCCVASSPVVLDLDGDGIPDVVSGSYAPGYLYWFKGLGGSQFADRQILTDDAGIAFRTGNDLDSSRCSIPAVVDWDADGRLDVITGNGSGRLFVRLSGGNANEDKRQTRSYAPFLSQPLFRSKNEEIQINGQAAVDDLHAAPAVGDWDGDGLWDIVVGTYTGAVYFLRNSGEKGNPRFASRAMLLPPGHAGVQIVAAGSPIKRGVSAQVQLADFDGDGRLDLIVGHRVITSRPRSNLSTGELSKLERIKRQLALLDESLGYDHSLSRSLHRAYRDNKIAIGKAEGLERQMGAYLESKRAGEVSTTRFNHGYVWVYRRQ